MTDWIVQLETTIFGLFRNNLSIVSFLIQIGAFACKFLIAKFRPNVQELLSLTQVNEWRSWERMGKGGIEF